MKNIIIAILITLSSYSFAKQEKLPPSFYLNLSKTKKIELIKLKEVDVAKSIKATEKKTSSKTRPFKIAHANVVNITPYSHGTWFDVPKGKVWKLDLESKGATDISFGFGKYDLPKGAELFLVSYFGDGSYYNGPFSDEQNKSHQQFWTPALPGGKVSIEMYVPETTHQKISLNLTNVATGFRDIFKKFDGSGLNVKAGSCNINTICLAADEWRDEIQSVAHYSFQSLQDGNTYVCTGTLVMDAERSFKPYFLTANHCDAVPSSVVTYWNYENVNCSDAVNGSTRSNVMQTISGSTLLAKREDVDMMLLELSTNVPESFNPYWSGWNTFDIPAASTVGIHHPAGDEKVISFNDDQVTSGSGCGGPDTHWYVDNWEQGTTEPGSSGSGLWDALNRQVVGFLTAGTASCSNPSGYDCYGKMSVAWSDGSTNDSSQLQLGWTHKTQD